MPKPIPDLKDDTIIKAFEEVFNDLKEKGYMFTLNVTDNQATNSSRPF